MSYLSQSSYRRQQPKSTGRLVGVVAVVLFHVGLIYALVTGLAVKVVQVVTEPIKAEIVDEIKPPPEETPPPPPPPKFDTPPPPFIPPPEITIAQPPPQPAAITTVTNERPPVVQPPGRPAEVPKAPPGPTGGSLDRASLAKNLPEYPEQSKRLEEEGVVVTQMYCNADGRISEARIVTSSGSERLDNAMLKAAARGRWKCEPPTLDGKPIPGWISTSIPYRFKLVDDKR